VDNLNVNYPGVDGIGAESMGGEEARFDDTSAGNVFSGDDYSAADISIDDPSSDDPDYEPPVASAVDSSGPASDSEGTTVLLSCPSCCVQGRIVIAILYYMSCSRYIIMAVGIP
jgi:hypothetical protein